MLAHLLLCLYIQAKNVNLVICFVPLRSRLRQSRPTDVTNNKMLMFPKSFERKVFIFMISFHSTKKLQDAVANISIFN